MFTKVIARKIWRSFFWPTLYLKKVIYRAPITPSLNKKWTPKQIAIPGLIQQKLVSFVRNFRRNNCKWKQGQWHIIFEKNTRQHRFYWHLKYTHWKYEVYNAAASQCSCNYCFTILCTDVLDFPVMRVSGAFSWLDTSFSTESTFWPIRVSRFLPPPGLQHTLTTVYK